MIYAKVDVDLRDNRKARSAGEAMATWTYGLLYSRGQELDGFIDREALRGGWVDEKTALKHAATLVTVGLWEVVDGGWKITNFSRKNDTKEVIDARKEADRLRKASKRKGSSDSASVPDGVRAESNGSPPGIPGLGTGTGLSPSSERDPRPTSTPRATEESGPISGPPSSGPPDWFMAAVSTVQDTTGEQLRAGEAWLRYHGHRTAPESRKAMSQPDAQYWLTTVDVPNARKDRETARRDQDRDKSFKARFDKPHGADLHEKLRQPTAAESRSVAQELTRRLAALPPSDRKPTA